LINLVVIGDSNYEMDAGELLSKTLDKSVVKTIKLKQAPSSSELIHQLRMLNNIWENIISAFKNLNIKL
jgi:hypothetical protein